MGQESLLVASIILTAFTAAAFTVARRYTESAAEHDILLHVLPISKERSEIRERIDRKYIVAALLYDAAVISALINATIIAFVLVESL